MITGEIKNQVDRIWDSFWSGGISNPLDVIEQITYLLFIRRLDDLHTLEENKSARLKKPMERRIFPEGSNPRGRLYEELRWSRFKHFAPAEMFTVVGKHVLPFLRTDLPRQLGHNCGHPWTVTQGWNFRTVRSDRGFHERKQWVSTISLRKGWEYLKLPRLKSLV